MPPAPNGKQGQKEEPEMSPFLGRELRVELTDGRVIVGTLIAYEGSGDLLLQGAVEQRRYKDGEVAVRGVNLLAIPFQYVKGLQRRLPGNELIQPAAEKPEEPLAA